MPEPANWAQLTNETVFVTREGLIVAGFGRWQLACARNETKLRCFQVQLSPEEALVFTLRHHQPRRGWIAFIRICVALSLEPWLKQRARQNMRTGGQLKGLTNLSNADRVDVRRQIATLGGTGTGNVNKVKAILRDAHPHIISALENDLLSIHRAWKWCKLPKAQQKLEFSRFEDTRNERKILQACICASAKPCSNSLEIIAALQDCEVQNPGSIMIRSGDRRKKTVVILGEDVRSGYLKLNPD